MLKKILFATFLMLGLTQGNGQENIVKASGMIGNLGVQYERALGSRFSLIGQLGYSSLNSSVNNVKINSNGLGYYFEGRFYFSSKKDRMEGWHIGPYYNDINTKDDDGQETNVSSVGLATGHQWVFGSNVTLGLVFGAGTFDIQSETNRGILLEGLTFLPHFGLNLGYRF